MTTKMKWIYGTAGAVVALVVIFGAALAFASTNAASRAAEWAPSLASTMPRTGAAGMNQFGLGFSEWFQELASCSDYLEALAQAIGITVDELEAAYAQAFETAITQAVDEGLMTQEQAEHLLSIDHPGKDAMRCFGGFGGDWNNLLAEALGISVSELEQAQRQVRSDLIAQAVEEGDMTREQADLIEARSALQPYLESAMQSAFESALQEAVADGVITQAQADQLLENRDVGLRGFGGGRFFGDPGRGGRGAFYGGGRLP